MSSLMQQTLDRVLARSGNILDKQALLELDKGLARALGWCPWRFGDPFQPRLKFRDLSGGRRVATVRAVGLGEAILSCGERLIAPPYGEKERRILQERYVPLNFWSSPGGRWQPDPPAYSSDLNVMFETERLLSDEQWEEYEATLWEKTEGAPEGGRRLVSAPAFSRASALYQILSGHTQRSATQRLATK